MPSASLSTLVGLFCDQQGLPVPFSLFTAPDKQAKQIRGAVSDAILDLSEYRWPEQRVRKTWDSVAGADQGHLTSIFGTGYYGLVQDTLWNETRKMRIFGPVSDAVWQAFQALPNAGPEYQYWISQGHLYISPALPVDDVLSAVYITKNVVIHAGTPNTYSDFVTADTDTFFFPNNVFLRCLTYKWKKLKGEPGWEDDYNDTLSLIARSIAKDTAPRMEMSPSSSGVRPGIVIPAGNWNV